jgi:CO dehydrogenase/acetyl-CoA synthase epsilon subunit
VFVDASALYLPEALAIHGKGAAAADFDGDGHEDLVLAVGRLGFVFDEGDDSIRSKNIDGMDLLHLPTTTHGLPPG